MCCAAVNRCAGCVGPRTLVSFDNQFKKSTRPPFFTNCCLHPRPSMSILLGGVLFSVGGMPRSASRASTLHLFRGLSIEKAAVLLSGRRRFTG